MLNLVDTSSLFNAWRESLRYDIETEKGIIKKKYWIEEMPKVLTF